MPNTFTCPHCGADVPIKALACPNCGSDKETGWSDAAQYVHLLPDRGDSGWDETRSRWQKPAIAMISLLIVAGFLASQGWVGWVILAIATGAAGSYILVQRFTNSRWGMERKLYQQLLSKAKGDRQLAERMLGYERKRNPHSNRLQHLQNAVFYFDRDRH